MSSVSSSGGSSGTSGQDEVTRKAREDYRKKEADLIKKHQKEMATIDKKYAEELSKLNQRHDSQLKEVTNKSSESLTKRDAKYQKEMDDIKKMHAKQYERMMADTNQKLEVQRTASRGEVKQANLGKADRTSELQQRYDEQLAQQSAKFSSDLEKLREDQKATVEQVRGKLDDAHSKEMESFRDYHNEEVAGLKNDLRRTRQSSTQKLRNQEIQHFGEKMRLSDDKMHTINKIEKDHNEIQKDTREGYETNLKEERQRFQEALEEKTQNDSALGADFKANVEDRLDAREHRLERELTEAKEDKIKAQTKTKQGAQREIRSTQNAYQQKFDYLEKARQDTLNQSNDINADNIRKVRKEASDVISTTNKQMLSRMDTENFRNREALASSKAEYDSRTEYQKDLADNRVNTVRVNSQQNEKRLEENYGANINVLKEGYEKQIKDLRLASQEEKAEAIAQMKTIIQKKETDHQAATQVLMQKYEKRISELNDQFMREKRLRDNREKQLVTDLKKSQASELEAVKMKYENQNQQTIAQHDKELQDVTRRHKEQVDNIMSASKKS